MCQDHQRGVDSVSPLRAATQNSLSEITNPNRIPHKMRTALAKVLKDHHYDPWNWHEYLADEPEDPWQGVIVFASSASS